MNISNHFKTIRQQTLDICAGLSPEDMLVQAEPDASPAKWHLAHTNLVFL